MPSRLFRDDLPRLAGADARRRRCKRLRRALTAVWTDDVIDRFLGWQDAGAPVRPAFLPPAWPVTTSMTAGWCLSRLPLLCPHADGIELEARGGRWVRRRPGDALRLALDRLSHRVGELIPAGEAGHESAAVLPCRHCIGTTSWWS